MTYKINCKNTFKTLLLVALVLLINTKSASAEGLPYINFIEEAKTPTENAFAVKQLLLLTTLTLIPSLILMLTPFVRISIVLSIMRQSLGLNQSPPNQVLLTLALLMSLMAMGPTISTINNDALKPYMEDKITIETALSNANKPIRDYMFKQVDKEELSLFLNLNKNINNEPIPKKYKDIPNTVLFPAYIIHEIKTGIFIGIIISIAFVIIDLATASVLLGMGMMMISPATISVIFKMMLFIFANGFEFIIQATMLTIK